MMTTSESTFLPWQKATRAKDEGEFCFVLFFCDGKKCIEQDTLKPKKERKKEKPFPLAIIA